MGYMKPTELEGADNGPGPSNPAVDPVTVSRRDLDALLTFATGATAPAHATVALVPVLQRLTAALEAPVAEPGSILFAAYVKDVGGGDVCLSVDRSGPHECLTYPDVGAHVGVIELPWSPR